MNRRHFLKSLLLIPGVSLLPKLSEQKPVQWPRTQISEELKKDIIVPATGYQRVTKWDGLGNSWELDDGKNWVQTQSAAQFNNVIIVSKFPEWAQVQFAPKEESTENVSDFRFFQFLVGH